MRMRRIPIVMTVAIAFSGFWSIVLADFPNIFAFTQKQDVTTTPGKLTLTYSPKLTETPQAAPYLLSATVTWINNSRGQTCNTMAMTHVSANTFTYAIDAAPGDTIDYYFTQRWVGQPQDFYAWIPLHQCTNNTDTKWFTYVMGVGFEAMPKWPLIIEGSERYRNRHEDEWRFDQFSGNYFQNTALNYKIADWGDSMLVILFPSEATNWSNGRFFGMSGYDTLCDHDTYADNRLSGNFPFDADSQKGFMGPAVIPYFGLTVEPFQATWSNATYPQIRWYAWMVRGLSYGQYIDYELSAARSLSDGQLYYSEPQRYYVGLGKISHKFQHPWANPAGDASINTVTFPEFAFSQVVQNAGPSRSSTFMKGKAVFDTDWGTGMVYNYATPWDCNGAPNSFPDTTHSPFFKPTMRGPIYRKGACFVCHFQDGKGYPEDMNGSDPNIKHLFTFFETVNADGSLGGHPVFGGSLETNATPPAVPQGQLDVTWDSVPGQYADGTNFMLRKPRYSFSNLGWGVTSIDLTKTRISPRYIINLTGLGMLEAIDESTILSFVNLPGKAGTGIAGKANRVDDGFTGPSSLGRFGWKADVANLKTEVYASVAGDVGISNMYFANEPYMNNPANPPEISVPVMDTLRTYISLLAPPPRQLGKGYIAFDSSIANATSGGTIWLNTNLYKGEAFEEIWTDPSAIRGKALFSQAKCDLCHIPAMRTGTNTDFAELKNLEIQPFTDMLIHDMGPQESDTGGATNGYVTGLAGPSDWRTSPLWGELYYPYSNKVALLMHDGRARGIAEAILWHFGEGTVSRNAFINMTAAQRADLIRYTQLPFADRLPKNAMASIGSSVRVGMVKTLGANPSIMCYPNPIRSVAMIRLQNIVGTSASRIVVSVYNVQGKCVFSQALGIGQSTVAWNTARCGAGKYLATVMANGKLYKKDLLVMR